MADIKSRMEAARSLIKAKDYDAARKLLQGIDHPRAKEWLAKIDEIDPFGAQPVPEKVKAKPVPEKKSGGCFSTVGSAVVIVFFGLLAYSLLFSKPTRPTEFRNIGQRAAWVVENANVGDVLKVYGDERTIQLHMKLTFLSAGYAVDDAQRKAVRAACAVYQDGLTKQEVTLYGIVDLVDAFGNEREDTGVRITFEPSTIAQIDCSNTTSVNVPLIADDYWIHLAVAKELD